MKKFLFTIFAVALCLPAMADDTVPAMAALDTKTVPAEQDAASDSKAIVAGEAAVAPVVSTETTSVPEPVPVAPVAQSAPTAAASEPAAESIVHETAPAPAAEQTITVDVSNIGALAKSLSAVQRRQEAGGTKVVSAKSRASISGSLRAPSITEKPTSAAIVKQVETTTTVVADADLDCTIGDMPQNGKCVPCAQKNNPGIIWKENGKGCEIESCVNDDYALVDAEKTTARCVKKCDVWGGTASREWLRDDAKWSLCGGGPFVECKDGFAKSYEPTSSHPKKKLAHCIPLGTMTGMCKENGRIISGEFPNGKCQQACENGFWGLCVLQKFCKSGFEETRFYDTIHIKDDTESVMKMFDCVPKEDKK